MTKSSNEVQCDAFAAGLVALVKDKLGPFHVKFTRSKLILGNFSDFDKTYSVFVVPVVLITHTYKWRDTFVTSSIMNLHRTNNTF